LYRELTGFGYDCRVIPPNTVFHGGDGQVKTDLRDAVNIARMLRRNKGESIEAELRQPVFMYLEAYYNRVRIHSTLDYVTPDMFNSGSVA
jgi:transposase InsO family protein